MANLRGTGLRLFKRFFWNLKAWVSLLAYGEGQKEKVKVHLTSKERGKRLPSKGRKVSKAPVLTSWLRIQLAKGAVTQGQKPEHDTASQMQAGPRNGNALGPGEHTMEKMLILVGCMPANTCLHEGDQCLIPRAKEDMSALLLKMWSLRTH